MLIQEEAACTEPIKAAHINVDFGVMVSVKEVIKTPFAKGFLAKGATRFIYLFVVTLINSNICIK